MSDMPSLKLAPVTGPYGSIQPGRTAEIVALEDAVTARAACQDAPEAHKQAFYPLVTNPAQAEADVNTAKSYCRRCPAAPGCLQLAFLTDAGRWGVWGNTTEGERRNMRRRLRRERAA